MIDIKLLTICNSWLPLLYHQALLMAVLISSRTGGRRRCDKVVQLSHSSENNLNQLLQLCTARTVFSMLATVRLYTVMPEVCRRLTNEKQRKTDIRLSDQ